MPKKCEGAGAMVRAEPHEFVRCAKLDGPDHSTPTPRLQFLAEHLHRLGPRALGEYVAELASRFGPDVLTPLDAYSRLDPEILHALGCDRFPPRLALLRGGRR